VDIRAQRASVVLGLILCFSITALGVQSVTPQRSRHPRRRPRLHRTSWNPIFRPSRESLLRQNQEIDRLDLPRIHDDVELRRLIASGDLVPIEEGESLRIERRLDPSRRYCRPWTRAFLEDFSEAYYQQFHRPIQVNSAVRTVVMQRKLRRYNRNAAPESGETASSHLAGITVDIQRRGMTRQQVQWVEQYLMPLKQQGLLEPEEERRQWVFHVAVSGRYADWHEAKTLAGEDTPRPDASPMDFVPQRVSDARDSNR
jgi:hypothetical protein